MNNHSYEDNPTSNLQFLSSLAPNELTLYVKGYCQACVHVREAFNKGKLELLNQVLALDEEDTDQRISMLHSVDILDTFEALIKRKEASLLTLFPETGVDLVEPQSGTL